MNRADDGRYQRARYYSDIARAISYHTFRQVHPSDCTWGEHCMAKVDISDHVTLLMLVDLGMPGAGDVVHRVGKLMVASPGRSLDLYIPLTEEAHEWALRVMEGL